MYYETKDKIVRVFFKMRLPLIPQQTVPLSVRKIDYNSDQHPKDEP